MTTIAYRDGVIAADAAPERVECWDNRGHCVVSAPYYAVGSGKRVAIGAMAFGADAAQAVNCAAKHDIYTGGTVETRKLLGNGEKYGAFSPGSIHYVGVDEDIVARLKRGEKL